METSARLKKVYKELNAYYESVVIFEKESPKKRGKLNAIQNAISIVIRNIEEEEGTALDF